MNKNQIGEIVYLGEFGPFSSTLSSSGTTSEETFIAGPIQGLNMNFYLGKELVQTLVAVAF